MVNTRNRIKQHGLLGRIKDKFLLLWFDFKNWQVACVEQDICSILFDF
jgi:hypothetical protein